MGERKVLNKYIPSDFDPKLVPRGKRPKDDLIPVRMMLPFSLQCSSCHTFLYRGRKFNSKKEPVAGVTGKYLGIQRYRLYIKCSDCSRPITFLTDPENADYEMESGGTRTYEVWRDEKQVTKDFERQLEHEEEMDSMKALENRVVESQREMAELDALEEIRAMNDRHVAFIKAKHHHNQQQLGGQLATAQAVLDAREAALGLPSEELLNDHGLTLEEEQLVKSIQFGKGNKHHSAHHEQQQQQQEASMTRYIRRLEEEDEANAELQRQKVAHSVLQQRVHDDKQNMQNHYAKHDTAKRITPNMPIVKAKRFKRKEDKIKIDYCHGMGAKQGKVMVTEIENHISNDGKKEKEAGPQKSEPSLVGLLAYGSDSD